jgi:hypothetical protein
MVEFVIGYDQTVEVGLKIVGYFGGVFINRQLVYVHDEIIFQSRGMTYPLGGSR